MIKIERETMENLLEGVRYSNYFKTIEWKDRLTEAKDDVDDCVKLYDVGNSLTEITIAALRVKPSMSNDQLVEMFSHIDIEVI